MLTPPLKVAAPAHFDQTHPGDSTNSRQLVVPTTRRPSQQWLAPSRRPSAQSHQRRSARPASSRLHRAELTCSKKTFHTMRVKINNICAPNALAGAVDEAICAARSRQQCKLAPLDVLVLSSLLNYIQQLVRWPPTRSASDICRRHWPTLRSFILHSQTGHYYYYYYPDEPLARKGNKHD